MSSKVYAVKKGRHPGIYNSWDDCKKQVNGYSGAEFKKLYNEASKTVKISFHKVKGHSGDKYNDLADSLAKQAVGI